jgi:hypothetical protein
MGGYECILLENLFAVRVMFYDLLKQNVPIAFVDCQFVQIGFQQMHLRQVQSCTPPEET